MTARPFRRGALCRFDALEDPGGKGFSINVRGEAKDILVVRCDNRIYSYLDSCPHTGVSLDWVSDQFLDLRQEFIQCATHGALFRIVDGHCVQGPCAGDNLTPVPVSVIDGHVIVDWTDGPSGGAQD